MSWSVSWAVVKTPRCWHNLAILWCSNMPLACAMQMEYIDFTATHLVVISVSVRWRDACGASCSDVYYVLRRGQVKRLKARYLGLKRRIASYCCRLKGLWGRYLMFDFYFLPSFSDSSPTAVRTSSQSVPILGKSTVCSFLKIAHLYCDPFCRDSYGWYPAQKECPRLPNKQNTKTCKSKGIGYLLEAC